MDNPLFVPVIPTLKFLALSSILNNNLQHAAKDGMSLVLAEKATTVDFQKHMDFQTKLQLHQFSIDGTHLNITKALSQMELIKCMKDHVCSIAKKNNAFVFGGYVRDFILGEIITNRDIDILFTDENSVNEFISTLMDNYIVHPGKETWSLDYSARKVSTWYIQNEDLLEISIEIDIVLMKEGNVTGTIDFDVNRLFINLDSDFDVIKHKDCEIDIKPIYENIINKRFIVIVDDNKSTKIKRHITIKIPHPRLIEFQPNDDCILISKIRIRIQKMQSRGWKMLNPECDNPLCALCPKHISEAILKRNDLIRKKINKKICDNFDRHSLALQGKFIWDYERDKNAQSDQYSRSSKSREIQKKKANKMNIKWRTNRVVDKGFFYLKSH